jgi:hypothetical protein
VLPLQFDTAEGFCSQPVAPGDTGFVLDLVNGQRVGVAVAEVFARRWRAVLSLGSLPEIKTDPKDQPDPQQPRISRTAFSGMIWTLLF